MMADLSFRDLTPEERDALKDRVLHSLYTQIRVYGNGPMEGSSMFGEIADIGFQLNW